MTGQSGEQFVRPDPSPRAGLSQDDGAVQEHDRGVSDAQDDRYWKGYNDGESSMNADWDFALTDIAPLPDDAVTGPHGTGRYLAHLFSLMSEVLNEAESNLWTVHSERCLSSDVDDDGGHVCDKEQEKITELRRLAGLTDG